jgi:phage baseplate assembly protein W
MSFDLEIVNSDLKIQSDGTIKTVSDTPKLKQDVIKMLITTLGSNKFHPWYGCAIGASMIGANLPDNMMQLDIQTSIQQSLDKLQSLQQAQMGSQRVTLAECIAQVSNISAGRNPIDPRSVLIQITVLSKRLSKIEETFTLTS